MFFENGEGTSYTRHYFSGAFSLELFSRNIANIFAFGMFILVQVLCSFNLAGDLLGRIISICLTCHSLKIGFAEFHY